MTSDMHTYAEYVDSVADGRPFAKRCNVPPCIWSTAGPDDILHTFERSSFDGH